MHEQALCVPPTLRLKSDGRLLLAGMNPWRCRPQRGPGTDPDEHEGEWQRLFDWSRFATRTTTSHRLPTNENIGGRILHGRPGSYC